MLVDIRLENDSDTNENIMEELVEYNSGDFLYQSHDRVLMWEQDYRDYKDSLGCHTVSNFVNQKCGPTFSGVPTETINTGDCNDKDND